MQLSTTHEISFKLPPAIVTSSPNNSASKVLALISQEESEYQTSLNEAYRDMGDKTFKGLRRALPMTRQKLDWDKVSGVLGSFLVGLTYLQVLGYRLGAELAQSKGVFGSS